MKVDEIRDRFLGFFEKYGHRVYPSDSLVPGKDPTLLFTGAGMNQFKDEFLGRVTGARRAATCQKCIRTGDLENVGRTPDHHTFFEMLGNFSFGDYFKKEAILWAWEFLTEELALKEKDLWVSVYTDDVEAYNIWKDIIKVHVEKILKLGAKENFWPSNAPSDGPNGPCGPCSEIFYGGADGVEVWNLVFTQFDRKGGGELAALPSKNIDTGMGLERIARVMQGKETNFEIDSFEPIVSEIKKYAGRSQKINTINAISDHIRAVTFAIGDGVLPSNEERGYVIRKLIRRAFWYGRVIGTGGQPFLYKVVPIVAKVMKRPYPEITKQREDIAQVVLAEEERFRNTIEEGLEKLNQMIGDARYKGILSGEGVFKLYDTYGFPLELTQEIATSSNIKVDLKGFEKCMAEQRTKSRQSSKIKESIFDAISLEDRLDIDKTGFIEDKKEMDTRVLKIIVGNEVKEEIKKNEKGNVFLKETNFYGEKGGQVGDTGVLLKGGKVIADVLSAIDTAGVVRHEVLVKEGVLKAGDTVVARIDITRRENIMKNHTATHLLHNALRKVLGQHVKQSGSLVASDRLRFDFTHFKALTDEELSRVEGLVNEYIKNDSSVATKEIAFNEASDEGAIAIFGEKYGDKVRMVSVGDYSKELCGGTHVEKTSDIEVFKIISESSIASGVRRIEAVTAGEAHKKIKENQDLIKELASSLETAPWDIPKQIEKLSDMLKKAERRLDSISNTLIASSMDNILDNAKKVKDCEVIIMELTNVDMGFLRKASDIIKSRMKKGIFVLLSSKDEKFSICLGMSEALKKEKLDAVKLLDEIGSSFGIKGGGRPDFAQAGGKAGIDIKGMLKRAQEIVVKNIKG
ncbi:MAG: alanine--tRNA ligase [Candidatus Omnitrophica bacterium]|nr:alanine--tRNA ligase [Candidatus Omnitrophota bacterium]